MKRQCIRSEAPGNCSLTRQTARRDVLGPPTQARIHEAAIRIDIEVCGRCGGSAKVIACIEDWDVIDRILAHLREKEQEAPARPVLVPPTRAPPGTPSLFAGKETVFSRVYLQGRH